MSRLTIRRRTLLKQLGLAAAAATPVFRAGIRSAKADQPVPQRFIGMFHANGWRVAPRDHYAYEPDARPRQRADDDLFFPGRRRDASYALDESLGPWPLATEPLQPFADSLVFVDGLYNAANRGANGHTGGGLTFLTGTEPIQGFDHAGGISLDRFLAKDNLTRFPSVNLGIGDRTVTAKLSNNGPGQPNRPDRDPVAAYARIFADFAAGGAEELMQIRARRGSLLDHAASELLTMQPLISRSDRPRLDAHLEAIRSMERRLDSPIVAGPGCAPLEVGRHDLDDDMAVPELSEALLDLLAAAFACDLTRMGTMFYGYSTGSYLPVWLGIYENLHAMSHWQADDPRQAEYTEALRWISEQVARLLERLRQIPTADGENLLHHSLMMWGTDNGIGTFHTVKDIPFILAGNAGGALQGGRVVSYPLETTHNGLLLSIAHAFGHRDLEHFGNPLLSDGPLPGLFT